MSRWLLERRLSEISERLKRMRGELAVVDEQLAFFADAADEARLRALVSETPLADRENHEAQKHADAMARASDHRGVDPGARALAGRAARPARRGTEVAPTEGANDLAVRVVIAEDEAIIRLDLKELLEEEGYEVVGETGRGDEAVELVKQLQPDLAILDIKMPGLDGLAAA